METKIYAVIDTNVIVSALFSISGQSNPATIIRKVVDGTITPVHRFAGGNGGDYQCGDIRKWKNP